MDADFPSKRPRLKDDFISECYFDTKYFSIVAPEEELIKRLYGEIAKTIVSEDDPLEIYSAAHQLHETCHYMHQIGTPLCLFENFISITSLIQTSFYIKLFNGTIKLPFYHHRNEYPGFLTKNYTFSMDFHSYLYRSLEPSKCFPLERIDKIGLQKDYSGVFQKLTRGKRNKLVTELYASFIQNGESFPECKPYIPVGLFSILEGFAKFIQEHFLLQCFPVEKVNINSAAIVSESRYLPYYLLRFYAERELNGLKKGEFGAVFASALYLSLMNFSPIFRKEINFRPDIEAHPDEMIELLSLLDHPSETFFNALEALKEIVEKDGGLEPGEKGVIKLINKACQEIGMPPLSVAYDKFSKFLINLIAEFYPLEFKEHPFALHFFDIGLEVMKIAKQNPYDFIVFPTEIMQKIGKPVMPYSSKGVFCTEVAPEKIHWNLYYNIMEQFFHKKRIFCDEKYLRGTNPNCENDKECSIDNYDYPYSKCEDVFIKLLNMFLGDPNRFIAS